MNILAKVSDLSWSASKAVWKLALSEPVLAVAQHALPVPAEAAERERVRALWRSAMREYRSDVEALPVEAFRPDLGRLARAWSSLLLGTGDARDQASGRQLLEAVRLKATNGAEVFAHPQTPVAPTARERVHRMGEMELFRYKPRRGRRKAGAPVLIVYSVINRSFILDLLKGFSFVEFLLQQGLDVYLIEWGPARPHDRRATLDAFVEKGIGGAVDFIRQSTGAPKVSLFGHCIGGVFASMYAALHPARVERLLALTTPFTAGEGGLVALWSDQRLFPVDEVIDRHGLMPGKLIRYTFMALKPYLEIMKWKVFVDVLGDEKAMPLFAAVDRWANENPDVPGEVFRRFIKEVYHEDGLRRGRTRIGRRRVDLGRITCPVLNVVAERDWIVPPASAEVMKTLVKSRDYRLLVLPRAAHVSLLVHPAYRTSWEPLAAFLREKSH